MEELLKRLRYKGTSIKSNFPQLFYEEIPTIPIPFFGDVTKAKIITVGINPSSGELRKNNWNSAMNEKDINKKLINYFKDNPHEWFETWEKALKEINYSYYDGTAAHIDICPWATKPSSSTDQVLFEKLLIQSIPDFYQVLEQCVNLEFIVLAGSVTKKWYLNKFLFKHPFADNSLLMKPIIKKPSPYTQEHILKIGDKKIKTFFCSVSPSARGNEKEKLILRIKENKDFFR